ncbi:unnamed protein product [Porites evermanni]|uniref:Uncharacterized protein n=1 Tax=Porites evermanni TaxID=104178 RepID=A0ABN8M407_9CNID|nr:unnamed protein product [Porites evermanni]
MKLLQSQGKTNLVYRFAYVIDTARPESDESLLPLNRTPFGWIEYQIVFFSSTNISQAKVPDDFAMWQETMCSEFPS